MLKIWGILRKNHKIIQDIVVVNEDENLTEDEQLDDCIEKICYQFDIPKPLWLSKHQREFQQFRRTVFKAEHFMENISFDSLEIESIIEKKKKI